MSNILLGVTGGIACYKAVYVLRLLKKSGHNVRVIMTEDAARFVGGLTFETLSESPVYIEGVRGAPIDHIDLANWADIFLIAPATANTIAKLAHGLADNLLAATALAAGSEIMVFPAMNSAMYMNPATQANIKTLIARGYFVAVPAAGALACDESGIGRLAEPDEIVRLVQLSLIVGHFDPILAGKHILVTAGPTAENIDSIRYISNHSSGKMGVALAEAAQALGGEVELICGPVSLKPAVENTLYVKSAADMLKAVTERVNNADILIMNSAVADYTPANPNSGKIKKSADTLSIDLVKTVDILKEAAKGKRRDQFFVGFAAECENSEENALIKLKEKGLNLIALNDVSKPGIGFNSDDNEVMLIFEDGEKLSLPKQPKQTLAYKILIKIAEKLKSG
ncbi:MAG: bifunctional phosphopantothenoylcysteine decarboxylase/phosphopantothenate--cysteine ligase CoaBC [Deferribacteraceae bacterium]|jgi:phosphopantothenoylcysteine decarboxylase/phosphopantothenate--cysteine ligase|nr:bifunctional phosphopantothenoylcysteine decarboxylase/phosphopantothenate--cysteine ligase CoaBC [Deferribacteraceae bacterium]